MRILFTTSFILCMLGTELGAQDGSEFDFWLGEWALSWEYSDGSTGTGKNSIRKILDGQVIQENFAATDQGAYQGFKGTSISVFNPNSKTWHQAWADNQGGYFNFEGDLLDGQKVFKTHRTLADGQEVILRMRFYDIKENSLTWDWEQSKDGGNTWVLQWRIYYKRII